MGKSDGKRNQRWKVLDVTREVKVIRPLIHDDKFFESYEVNKTDGSQERFLRVRATREDEWKNFGQAAYR